ncbi:hypothetical protein HPB47_027007 [Ixodes persulcatus]|uniref:Uncharacterized protein n=1 Tax=Ixodes persulcatus TaxID=34615 RepID=A0AC60PYS4_IXOPE|nr:hypothetical protein HPB47_027007 [Ixodes persulcatus]
MATADVGQAASPSERNRWWQGGLPVLGDSEHGPAVGAERVQEGPGPAVPGEHGLLAHERRLPDAEHDDGRQPPTASAARRARDATGTADALTPPAPSRERRRPLPPRARRLASRARGRYASMPTRPLATAGSLVGPPLRGEWVKPHKPAGPVPAVI